jgi:hypothetical protein
MGADDTSVASTESWMQQGSGSGSGQAPARRDSRPHAEFNAMPSLPPECGGSCHPSQVRFLLYKFALSMRTSTRPSRAHGYFTHAGRSRSR